MKKPSLVKHLATRTPTKQDKEKAVELQKMIPVSARVYQEKIDYTIPRMRPKWESF